MSSQPVVIINENGQYLLAKEGNRETAELMDFLVWKENVERGHVDVTI